VRQWSRRAAPVATLAAALLTAASLACGRRPTVAQGVAPAEYRLVGADGGATTDSALAPLDTIPVDLFEAHTFDAPGGPRLAYRLLHPAAVEPGPKYPLVIVFHGSGEIGVDNRKHVNRFVKMWGRERLRAEFPAYVLAPQMPERSALYDRPAADPARRSRPAPPLAAVLALVDSLRGALPIDPERVYAVGFSMGASTTWNALVLRPELFAAGVAFGGVPTALPLPPALPPLWLVHGGRDETNPIGPTSAAFERLRASGARVRFWEYAGLGHVVPPDLLSGEELPGWLFAHRR
jgi:predicted peptidase